MSVATAEQITSGEEYQPRRAHVDAVSRSHLMLVHSVNTIEEQSAENLELKPDEALLAKKALEYYGDTAVDLTVEARDDVRQAQRAAQAIIYRVVGGRDDIVVPRRSAGLEMDRKKYASHVSDEQAINFLIAQAGPTGSDFSVEQVGLLGDALQFFDLHHKEQGVVASAEAKAARALLGRLMPTDETDDVERNEVPAVVLKPTEEAAKLIQQTIESHFPGEQMYPARKISDDEYRSYITQDRKTKRELEKQRRRQAIDALLQKR